MQSAEDSIRAWDLPTRLFHWSLAAAAVVSFVTARAGGSWMAWHLRSGYAVLALLLFRIAWGFVGSDTARFARFLRGPRAALAYGRSLMSGRAPRTLGHNPLGGWMVAAMIAAFLLQASTGLFADDEIAHAGPLAAAVSNAWVARMSAVHSTNQWVVAALALLHVAAIAFYRIRFGENLVGAMLHGRMPSPAQPPLEAPRQASLGLAAAIMAVSSATVYWLVSVYAQGLQ